MEIPGYRDFQEIGRGGASVVYSAYQEQFARTVAVKVLSVSAVEERLRRRFERECAATGRLTGHPNIATVLDNGYTAEGSPYITTAYYAHGSLGDRLAKQGPLPLDEVLTIGVKVAGALEAVHQSEILHRDIKPSNLLESGYGEPALTGFGISAIDPAQQAMTMAQSFAPVHTPPEVVLGKQATEATDTYQLASTLYTLLCGHAPFETGEDDGIFQMLSRIQEDEVPPIDDPPVPMAVIEVLRVAMAKKPEDRYPSSAAFGERLQALQQELGLATTALVSAVDGSTPDHGRSTGDETIVISNLSELTGNIASGPPESAPLPSIPPAAVGFDAPPAPPMAPAAAPAAPAPNPPGMVAPAPPAATPFPVPPAPAPPAVPAPPLPAPPPFPTPPQPPFQPAPPSPGTPPGPPPVPPQPAYAAPPPPPPGAPPFQPAPPSPGTPPAPPQPAYAAPPQPPGPPPVPPQPAYAAPPPSPSPGPPPPAAPAPFQPQPPQPPAPYQQPPAAAPYQQPPMPPQGAPAANQLPPQAAQPMAPGAKTNTKVIAIVVLVLVLIAIGVAAFLILR